MCDNSITRREGARLMMLGKRLNARVDYPGYYAVLSDPVAASTLTRREWDEATGDIPAMPRRRAIDELVSTLASRTSS